MRKGVWSVILLATFCIMSAIASSPRREETREALRKLRERAEAGDAKALYDLAYLYDTGYDTIPVDSALSSALYRASAEKGYAPARNYLGFRYYNGEGGLRRDIDSALFWRGGCATMLMPATGWPRPRKPVCLPARASSQTCTGRDSEALPTPSWQQNCIRRLSTEDFPRPRCL